MSRDVIMATSWCGGLRLTRLSSQLYRQLGLTEWSFDVRSLVKSVVIDLVPMLLDLAGSPPIAKGVVTNPQQLSSLGDLKILVQLRHFPLPLRRYGEC